MIRDFVLFCEVTNGKLCERLEYQPYKRNNVNGGRGATFVGKVISESMDSGLNKKINCQMS